jgi:hypothetical protein
MEGWCSTGQSPQWAAVPVEEEDINYAFLGCSKNNKRCMNHVLTKWFLTVFYVLILFAVSASC